MKISNKYRNLFKMALLLFIVVSTTYVLLIASVDYKTQENLSNMRDCSTCIIKPDSGNCVPIYDISYTYKKIGTSNKYSLDICNIITNNVFCEWESQCMFDNITSQNDRALVANSNINQSIYDTTCCSGSSFYNNNDINFNYSVIKDNTSNITDCAAIKGIIQQSMGGTIDLSYDQSIFNTTNRICNTLQPPEPGTKSLFNKRGMLFSKTETKFNIFTDPKTMPSDIINYISFSNIRNEIIAIINGSKIPTVSPALLNGFNDIRLNNIITQLTQLNDALALKAKNENLQRQLKRSDLTSTQNTFFVSILNTLQNVYSIALPNSLLEERKDFSYRLVNNNKIGQNYTPYNTSLKLVNPNQYLLNSNQFFNCMGEINEDISASFTPAQLNDFSTNDYFGTAGRPISQGGLGEASYNALGSIQNNSYPSNKDLEMELRRLETVPVTGNAPVSVISSYLNAINSFYEKQIQNASGPREHTYNQQLVFDNNSLKTKESTFFTYNKDANSVYDCKPSITGNSKFEYCGPEAYYESPRF
jgi:hypothetical protein